MGWFSKKATSGKTRVLVVDDDALTREICMKFLGELGYEAEGARGGADALDQLGRGMKDIIITDVIMPDMDGKALLRQIKQRYPHSDVILMTASPNIVDVIVSMKLGAYDYLIKPVNKDMLELTMKRCLEKRTLRLERDAEQALRKKLEIVAERMRQMEKDRKILMDDHGVPLLKLVKEVEGALGKASNGVAGQDREELAAIRARVEELSRHLKTLLDFLAQKVS